MAEPTGLSPHRPGQGIYARSATAGVLVLVALFAGYRLYYMLVVDAGFVGSTTLLGVKVPYATLWAAGLFVVLGALAFLFTFAVPTGLAALDSKTRASVDLLIDTEGELAKVSWPGRDDLLKATSAVLVLIIVLGVFLYGADRVVTYVLALLGVLPR